MSTCSFQGFKGRRQWLITLPYAPCKYSGIYRNKTMDNKLMYIPNDDTLNYSFCRLRISGWNVWTQILMNQPIKIQYSSKLLRQRIRKHYYKNLGTSVINISMALSSLVPYTNKLISYSSIPVILLWGRLRAIFQSYNCLKSWKNNDSFQIFNSYLSHRIIKSFPRIYKLTISRLKPVFIPSCKGTC